MGDRFFTGFMCGLQAGGSGVRLGSVVLLLLVLFFFRKEVRLQVRAAVLFLGSSFILAAISRMGILQVYIPSPDAFWSTPVVLMILGVVLFAAGCLFAREWIACYRSDHAKGIFLTTDIPSLIRGPVRYLFIIVLGALMGWALTAWPVGPTMLLIINEMLLPGMLWSSIWTLMIYELSGMLAPAVMACLVIWLCSSNQGREILRRYRSGILALLAAVHLAAGVGLVAVSIKWIL